MNLEGIKGFISRLRINHITIITFSFLVFISLNNDDGKKIDKARKDLKSLTELDFIGDEKKWVKTLLDSSFRDNIYKQNPLFSGHSKVDSLGRLFVPRLGGFSAKINDIFGSRPIKIPDYISTFKRKIFFSDLPIPDNGERPLEMTRSRLFRINYLDSYSDHNLQELLIKDLRKSWNELHENVDIYVVESINNERLNFRLSPGNLDSLYGEFKIKYLTEEDDQNFRQIDNKKIFRFFPRELYDYTSSSIYLEGPNNVSPSMNLVFISTDSILGYIDEKILNLNIHKKMDSIDGLNALKKDLVRGKKVIRESKEYTLFYFVDGLSLIPVTSFQHVRLNMHDELSERAKENWKSGQFSKSFPELNNYFTGLESLSLSQGLKYLNNLSTEVDQDIEFAGFKIKTKAMAQYGIIIVFLMQMYYMIHLLNFSRKTLSSELLSTVPWMGLYKDKLSIIFWTILDFIPSSVILWSIVDNLSYMTTKFRIVNFIILLLSIILFIRCTITYWRLRKLI